MTPSGEERIIPTGSDESRDFVADVERTMALTARINALTYADLDEVRSLFAELAGAVPGDGFRLIPPFFADCGRNIHIGTHVFINQGCTIYSLAPVSIGDEALIGPNVSLITSGHPVSPTRRLSALTGRPITVARNVWIGAGATVIGGVTIGEHSVVAAGSVVTRDVPPNTLVGGNPAAVIRSIEGE